MWVLLKKKPLEKLELLHSSNPVVVMVGGSGLYVNAVLKGFDEFPDIAPEIRDTTQLGIGIKRLGVSSGRIKTTGP